MAKFEKQFFSIVLLGRQNPKILNHDFLVNNKIISLKHEPFKSLLNKEKESPFSEFISTPVLASIKYDYISIVVQEDRFQIIDRNFLDPSKSIIVSITKNYFGKILRFTPFQLGGMNFNGFIQFNNKTDESRFDKSIGMEITRLRKLVKEKDTRIGYTFSFPFENGTIETQITKPKELDKPARINFNYEYEYQDIDSFMKHLGTAPIVFKKFLEMLRLLEVETV